MMVGHGPGGRAVQLGPTPSRVGRGKGEVKEVSGWAKR